MSEFRICLSGVLSAVIKNYKAFQLLFLLIPSSLLVRYFVKCLQYFAHICTSNQGDCCSVGRMLNFLMSYSQHQFYTISSGGSFFIILNLFELFSSTVFRKHLRYLIISVIFNVFILALIILENLFPRSLKEWLKSSKEIPGISQLKFMAGIVSLGTW
ncbi:uncharacterized protein EV154DRAFT_486753 [Mucor mucedo]|uniref:uncharacterized protein n=1 Tax=Mucor mucedo TaxID=29922 RepID=UPI00221E8BB9|nr:uncharacterized protein EV154DRAFT_486753 [Mucor mucedo]KAI7875369.1 hypothetical protein EV154DRAFT_486753 [Mucor mucedo]